MNDSISSPLINLLFCGAALFASTTKNPFEAIWSIALLRLFIHWFFWAKQASIVFIAFLIPYTEIHTLIIEANSLNLTIDQVYPNPAKSSFWMSSMGLLFVAMGFKTFFQKTTFQSSFSHDNLRDTAERISQRILIGLSIATLFASKVLNSLIPWGSGLHQFETYFAAIHTALLFAVAVHFNITRKRTPIIIIYFLALLASSFYSYFSDWKSIFIIILATSTLSIERLNTSSISKLIPILGPAILLLFLWQGVKSEYRHFLSKGERTQAIKVSQGEALSKFAELATEQFSQDTVLSDQLVASTYRRIGYLEYYSATCQKVPTLIPHEHGALLSQSLTFSLIPRILAPNKGVKNDRAKVEKYTDYYFGENSFASFSLGHYCEAYIDWGPKLMMIHLFIYGALGAIILNLVTRQKDRFNPILVLGISFVLIQPWSTFQSDMVTISGTLFWGTICQLVIFRPLYAQLNTWMVQST